MTKLLILFFCLVVRSDTGCNIWFQEPFVKTNCTYDKYIVNSIVSTQVLSKAELERTMFIGPIIVSSDEKIASVSLMANPICSNRLDGRMKRLLNCDGFSFWEGFLVMLPFHYVTLCIIRMIRKMKRVRLSLGMISGTWTKRGRRYSKVTGGYVSFSYITLLLIFISLSIIEPSQACKEFKVQKINSNLYVIEASLYPGESICIDHGWLKHTGTTYKFEMNFLYHTSEWLLRNTRNVYCIWGDCNPECNRRISNSTPAYYSSSNVIYLIKYKCTWRPGEGPWCVNSISCLQDDYQIEAQKKFFRVSNLLPTRPTMEVKMNLPSYCHYKAKLNTFSNLLQTAAIVQSRSSKTKLCLDGHHKGNPRLGSLGDIQITNMKSSEGIAFDWEFDCNQDYTSGVFACAYKESFIKSGLSTCGDVPGYYSGFTTYMDGDFLVLRDNEAQDYEIICSQKPVLEESHIGKCGNLRMEVWGTKNLASGLRLVAPGNSPNNEHVFILESDCFLTGEEQLLCDDKDHIFPITRADCAISNVTSKDMTLTYDQTQSVKDVHEVDITDSQDPWHKVASIWADNNRGMLSGISLIFLVVIECYL